MTKTVKFANKEDSETIHLIIERLRDMWDDVEEGIDYLSLEMDISAVHVNGCQLRLKELLEAPNYSFLHDVFGIQRNINRKTGKLKNCFCPQFAESK